MADTFKKMMSTGDSIKDIMYYWFPEFISAMILFTLPPIIDSYLVASLQSTATYGALGLANNFLHLLIKFSEAIPVASIVIIGRHNGAQEYDKCGQDLGDSFWTTTFIGAIFASFIFFYAHGIYNWLGVPQDMVRLGVPFLRLRAIGILLTFSSLAFFAFLRGIKNTKAPMIIFSMGMAIFILCDYTLILGKFGFPKLGLQGSAIATISQYSFIISASIIYIFFRKKYRKYFNKLFFKYFSTKRALRLLNLSWPIIIDKGSLAFSYVWLSKMLAPMGKHAIVSYDIIKNLERAAILPAVGFAQIIIFLVSNRLGAKDPEGAKSNIKKVLILTGIGLTAVFTVLCFNAKYFVSFFDPLNNVTSFAAPALIVLSILVIFDFVQLVLAGALRGAGDVRTVMWGRFFCCLLFFMPAAYFMSKLPIENQVLKFILIYGTFYINTGIIGIIFLKRIKTPKWYQKKI